MAKKCLLNLFIAVIFLFSFFFGFSIWQVQADTISDSKAALEEKKAKLEEEISRLRQEIDALKLQVGQKESEKKNLKKEVDILNGKIRAIELEIKATELEVEQLSFEISSTEEKIKTKGDDLLRRKDFLTELMRVLYFSDNKSLTEVFITYDKLSDFWDEFQKNETLQRNIKDAIENIKIAKLELENNKVKLLDEQEEKNYLLELKENQNRDLTLNKKEKQKILTSTINEQKELQKQLEKGEKLLPAMIAQLRSLEIAGQVINADMAIAAAKFASQATGVRPAYLLGILKVETNLGANLGSGYYKTDMNPSQQPTFLEIINELGLPETVPVSKKPRTYSGWGGAMGPAQMMPLTWTAYKAGVTSITGSNPPNPWDIKDAVVAMALKVSQVAGVVGANFNAEYEAAARYFAGDNWRKFVWYAKNSSGTGVMDWAERYEELLKGG